MSMRQTALSIEELIDAVSDTSVEKRCLFVNELGVLYIENDGKEKEEAFRKLIELLNDKEEDVRYPAYLFLRDAPKNPDHTDETKKALKAFRENPDNKQVMAAIRRHDARRN